MHFKHLPKAQLKTGNRNEHIWEETQLLTTLSNKHGILALRALTHVALHMNGQERFITTALWMTVSNRKICLDPSYLNLGQPLEFFPSPYGFGISQNLSRETPSNSQSFRLNLCFTAKNNIWTKYKTEKRCINLFFHSLLPSFNLFQGMFGLCIKS